ncbi:MAG: hypothetical protein ACLFS4_07510 [Opitutales bacterium]
MHFLSYGQTIRAVARGRDFERVDNVIGEFEASLGVNPTRAPP